MVRTHKRKLGSRAYKNYSDEQLNKAVDAVLKGMTLRKAQETFKVKRETVRKAVSSIKSGIPILKKPVGGQTALNEHEEAALVQHVVSLAKWGFPITTMELRLIVKSYLERHGKTVRAFADGSNPGEDWALSFMKRHKQKLNARDVTNINPNRAHVSPDDINKYFDNLQKKMHCEKRAKIFSPSDV